MPENTSTTSEPADDISSAPFVLDFLYHDSRRIGSFLAQFEGQGHLQQFTQTKTATRGKNESSRVGGNANVGFASASLQGDVQTVVSTVEGLARSFDPFWANARTFLNYLSEQNLLVNDPAEATIGQFLLVRGYLSVLDLAIMKDAWKFPSIQAKVFGGAGKQIANMTAAQKKAAREEKENHALTIDMMSLMPHSIHASLITSDEDHPALVWGTLREEHLSQPASDIMLTHGARLPGEWTIVGILTAHPEYAVPDFGKDLGEHIGTLDSMVGAVSKQLAPIVRFALGRPSGAYAVTPLLIFREVVSQSPETDE